MRLWMMTGSLIVFFLSILIVIFGMAFEPTGLSYFILIPVKLGIILVGIAVMSASMANFVIFEENV